MDLFLKLFKTIIFGFFLGLIISVPLGPAGIESIKRTISKNFKEGFIVSLGALTADMSYLLMINMGLYSLLEKNEKTKCLFWIISGGILVIIGYLSIKDKNEPINNINIFDKINFNSLPFLAGFLITFSNPMTPTLWISLSATVLPAYRYAGRLYYLTVIFSILAGMVVWFALLNYFAYKGVQLLNVTSTHKASKLLKYVILFLGLGFMIFGIFRYISLII